MTATEKDGEDEKRKLGMFCANWYHLYNFKNVKNTHGVVLILVLFKVIVFQYQKIAYKKISYICSNLTAKAQKRCKKFDLIFQLLKFKQVSMFYQIYIVNFELNVSKMTKTKLRY